MITFDTLWSFTKHVSYETAFHETEGRAFYDTLLTLDPGSQLVEVGIQHGRSTSILAQVARDAGHKLFLIDPMPESTFCPMMDHLGVAYHLVALRTEDVPAALLPEVIDFVHIDGDHSADGITIDCLRLLPRVRRGGYACFHDYRQQSLPEVEPTVNKFVCNGTGEWKQVSFTHSLLIVRRAS